MKAVTPSHVDTVAAGLTRVPVALPHGTWSAPRARRDPEDLDHPGVHKAFRIMSQAARTAAVKAAIDGCAPVPAR
ncbi:hypothetical protein Dsi01nite_067260 [Dactylosporangium siamense]|uniref:Uncharacterized protein n=1 Tax=Dactylosporangium siamense TaxID=685454 RepID=A0A919UEJ0_9ACTN|nr:hypothetical protein Dsi01nite_067260 [Dactylosporangium siamense]